MACELYCCLLPQCEALRICRSGFSIATLPLKLPDVFTANLAEAGKRLFFFKSVPEAGILKINNFP